MIPLQGRAFLDAIAIGEDNDPLDYDELVGGGRFKGFDGFPVWDGWRGSHAAGRYQFEPRTWQSVAAILGLKDFSPVSQDEAAWWLACDDYKRRCGRDLIADLDARRFDWQALRPTWTSIGPLTFERYRGALVARRMLAA